GGEIVIPRLDRHQEAVAGGYLEQRTRLQRALGAQVARVVADHTAAAVGREVGTRKPLRDRTAEEQAAADVELHIEARQPVFVCQVGVVTDRLARVDRRIFGQTSLGQAAVAPLLLTLRRVGADGQNIADFYDAVTVAFGRLVEDRGRGVADRAERAHFRSNVAKTDVAIQDPAVAEHVVHAEVETRVSRERILVDVGDFAGEIRGARYQTV